jgi:copper chaperone CopZ
MTRISRGAACLVILLSLASWGDVQAVSPVPYTTIYVQNMHCADCAKQIARKLYAIPGVVEVRADVAKNIAYVVPQKDKSLHPRALWEAVESAGFQVARLEGPHGAFTSKPGAR